MSLSSRRASNSTRVSSYEGFFFLPLPLYRYHHTFTLTIITLPFYPCPYTLNMDCQTNKKDAQESIYPLRVPNGAVAAHLLWKHIFLDVSVFWKNRFRITNRFGMKPLWPKPVLSETGFECNRFEVKLNWKPVRLPVTGSVSGHSANRSSNRSPHSLPNHPPNPPPNQPPHFWNRLMPTKRIV